MIGTLIGKSRAAVTWTAGVDRDSHWVHQKRVHYKAATAEVGYFSQVTTLSVVNYSVPDSLNVILEARQSQRFPPQFFPKGKLYIRAVHEYVKLRV